MEEVQIEQLAEFVRGLVRIPQDGRQEGLLPGFEGLDEDIQEETIRKVDMLERALHQIRILYRRLDNELPVEEFLTSSADVEDGTLVYTPSTSHCRGQSTTSPSQLQTRLLVFLLLHHGTAYKVYDIIDRFVNVVWPYLHPLDFERTRTGAMRCFTNTRCAANMLRDYGLLRYTQVEAYKTWVLSLPGFVVASKLVESRVWKPSERDRCHWIGLHPEILAAWKSVGTYDAFTNHLSNVCRPEEDVFTTFGDVLRVAYRLLADYWGCLLLSDMTKSDRIAATRVCLQKLAATECIDEFYEEFSACLYVKARFKDFEGTGDQRA